jgi:phage gp46-like protein
MTDLRIVQVVDVAAEAVTMDLLLSGGVLDATQDLATAVTIALGTDRRATADDALPDLDSDDRRGWWGDTDAESIWDGWPIGTRLWLLERAKITGPGARQGSTLARVENYAREALQPFIRHGIASKVTVAATRTALDRIDLTATIYRGPKDAIQLRYQDLWTGG